jgi:hypothetical protein
LTEPGEQHFYQLTKGRESTILSNSEGEFMTIYLRTDEMYQFYDRKVYSIGDLIGQIGGFFEVIHALGMFLTFLIAERLATAALATRVYHISDNESPPSSNNSQDSNNDRHNKMPITKKPTRNISVEEFGVSNSKINYNEDLYEYSAASKEINSRKPFKYTWKTACHYFLCLGWITKCLPFKSTSLQSNRNSHKLLKIADKKLKQDLDIVDLILTIRDLKGLMKLLLTKDQRMLLGLQKTNVLNEENNRKGKNKVTDEESRCREIGEENGIDLVERMNSDVNRGVKGEIRAALAGLDYDSPVDRKLY